MNNIIIILPAIYKTESNSGWAIGLIYGWFGFVVFFIIKLTKVIYESSNIRKG